MSVPPNIDRFNKATLLIFDKLYEAFPVPIEISASKIAMETLPPDATYDATWQSFEPAFHTLMFLRTEGFIEYGQIMDSDKFLQTRLTAKSLTLLGQTPSSLEAQVSIGDRIRSLAKGGIKEVGSEAAKKVVELLFTQGPSLLTIAHAAVGAAL